MLNCAWKPNRLELLECLDDKPEEKKIYINALITLALKTQFEDKFDNEDIEMKKTWYKEWGQNRQNDF